ncbi:hypothetical protein [Massilia litorea]|jgi:hypothetical protein|uniref:Uncharacterized protein n=1 Tax=Massilia litorea TaxID=2769491 RepID=A0A7L9U350_9BURK|nr:hypothetical protein [Massilia litorea]QOL48545.1 hypothetical protein LPB04_16460 [Massilia litorea]
MSTIYSLPRASTLPSAASLTLFQRATQFIARLFSANAVDTSDVWKLYRAAGTADSVSPQALKALAAAARTW